MATALDVMALTIALLRHYLALPQILTIR